MNFEIENDFYELEDENNFSTSSNESFFTESNCLDNQDYYEHDIQTTYTQESIFIGNDTIDNDLQSVSTQENIFGGNDTLDDNLQTVSTQENIFGGNDTLDDDLQTVSTQENIFGDYNVLEDGVQVASTQTNIFGNHDTIDSSQNIASTQDVEEINPQPQNSLGDLIEKYATNLSNNISIDSEKGFTRVGYTQPNIFGGYDYYSCFSGKSRVSPALFSNLVLDTAKDIFNSLTDEVIPNELKDK